MNRRNGKTAILGLLCLMLAVTFSMGLHREKSGTTRKLSSSSLLNSRYLPTVSEITINQVGYSPVILQKRNVAGVEGARWFVRTVTTPGWYLADTGTVEQFLSELSKTTTFSEVTDRRQDWESLGITDAMAVTVTVSVSDGNGNDTVVSSLNFGTVSAAGTHITVRNDRKPTVYQVRDGFTRFFTDDVSFWADPALFPESGASSDWISSFSVEYGGYTRLFLAGEQRFETLADLLHTFSGGQFVLDAESDDYTDSMEFVAGIYAVGNTGTNRFYDVSLFKTETGTCIAECLSPFGRKVMTVSAWTAQRLLSVIE
ncbi:MAG: DUF4340 domain-containing protein [Treponemataceae bacterium]|nr:DUF4340 domain-containing protein [Treponemataceae bacterium]